MDPSLVTAAAAQKVDNVKSFNQFVGGQKYDLLFVYAKASTKQTYTMYVGKDLTQDQFDPTMKVLYGHSDITGGTFPFTPATKTEMDKVVSVWPSTWTRTYDSKNGWLTIGFDFGVSEVKGDFDFSLPTSNPLGMQLCRPGTMCSWNQEQEQYQCNIRDKTNYLYDLCHEKTASCAPNCPSLDCTATPDDSRCVDAICSWSVKDLDCPIAGCEAIEVTMPDNFMADDAADHHRPPPTSFASDKNYNWNVMFNNEDQGISGQQCHYTTSQLP
jgi:cell migration-inducing and hyaluronan-binding protein